MKWRPMLLVLYPVLALFFVQLLYPDTPLWQRGVLALCMLTLAYLFFYRPTWMTTLFGGRYPIVRCIGVLLAALVLHTLCETVNLPVPRVLQDSIVGLLVFVVFACLTLYRLLARQSALMRFASYLVRWRFIHALEAPQRWCEHAPLGIGRFFTQANRQRIYAFPKTFTSCVTGVCLAMLLFSAVGGQQTLMENWLFAVGLFPTLDFVTWYFFGHGRNPDRGDDDDAPDPTPESPRELVC